MENRKVPCDIYSRVVGYYRPVAYWNTGKREEFRNRKVFDMGKIDLSDIIRETPSNLLNPLVSYQGPVLKADLFF